MPAQGVVWGRLGEHREWGHTVGSGKEGCVNTGLHRGRAVPPHRWSTLGEGNSGTQGTHMIQTTASGTSTREPGPPSQELGLSKELGPGTNVESQSVVTVEVRGLQG